MHGMKHEAATTQAPSAAEVQDALAQLEASRSFRGAARHRALLRHLATPRR
jgi:hypothetical protein